MPGVYKNRLKTTIINSPGLLDDFVIYTAVTGFRTFDVSMSGQSFDMVVVDNAQWEVRTDCIYTHATSTLSRGTLLDSSTGSAIDLTNNALLANNRPAEEILDTSVTLPIPGQLLQFDGNHWVNSTISLGTSISNLSDCNITTLLNQQYLQWNGVSWTNMTRPDYSTITSLTDVGISSPFFGQVLTWNGAQWVNTFANNALSGLSDVALGVPAGGDYLKWDTSTSKWKNAGLLPDPRLAGTISITPPLATGGNSWALGNSAIAVTAGSIALGDYSTTSILGEIAIATGAWADFTPVQTSMILMQGITIDATPLMLGVAEGGVNNTPLNHLVLPDNSVNHFTFTVVANGGAGKFATWDGSFIITRDTGASTTSIHGLTMTAYNPAVPTWAITITPDITFGGVDIQVTGDTSAQVKWMAKLELVKVVS